MEYQSNENTIIPSKNKLVKIVLGEYINYDTEKSQKGTNCSGQMINFIKNGKNTELFTKKSFLKGDITKFEEEYKLIKSKFKNIVPNQGFVGVGGNIFAFCAPIQIKIDILGKHNKILILTLIKQEPKVLKQIKFFIKKFEELLSEGLILDLYGNENLVISNDNKLYYLDSFLIFHQSKNIYEGSIKNLEFLKSIVKESKI